jgi:hypothetical protein
MAIRAWRAMLPAAVLVAWTSSLGCMSTAGGDGGHALTGTAMVGRDGGGADDARAADAGRADRTNQGQLDGAAGIVADASGDVKGPSADANVDADAANATDVDDPDAGDAAESSPSACVLGASTLGACFMP